MKNISVVIVNWNTESFLKECLESIYKFPCDISFEVIVVDNDSKDNSASMIKNDFPQVVLVANDSNIGYAKANNQAVKLAKGEFILLLNPDIVISSNDFKKMTDYACNNSSSAVITCKLLNPDGTLQDSFYRRLPRLHTVFFYFLFAGRMLDKMLFKSRFKNDYFYADLKFEKVEKVEQAGASCLLISKNIIDKIGLFDEQFPIYFNDVDFCKRVSVAGHEIHVLPDVKAIHYGGCAVSQLPFNKNYIYFYSGMYRYFKKHFGLLKALLTAGLMVANFPFVLLFLNPFSQLIRTYFIIAKKDGFKAANEKVRKKLRKKNKTFYGKDI